jgi:hypothetical protein
MFGTYGFAIDMIFEVTEPHALLLADLIESSLVYVLLVVHLGVVLLHGLCLLVFVKMTDLEKR